MDKTQITQIASQMSTREDLLALLNYIKQDEICELGFDSDKFYPYTMKQLLYYCNPNHAFHRYHQFKIKKKSGGFRLITSPRNQSFMMFLRSINEINLYSLLTHINPNEILKSMYTPCDYAMGFAEKRSVVTNAAVHKGQNYVFNIDLKDFFPSIEQGRIMKRLTLAPFNFSPQIALLISGLCSMRVKRDLPIETKQHDLDKRFKYVLPQGAPTSPIITNMICDTLDRKLAGLAKRFGLHYTRYADDITFSSMHYVYSEKGEFRNELARIINAQGFIVSDELNVTKKYVREIRSLLYIWDQYGYSIAMSRFYPKYKAEKGHVKKGNPDLANVLDGKLMYLKMVKGDNDSVYVRLHTKFQELVNRNSSSEKTNSCGITYIESVPLLKFEEDRNTNVVICRKNDNKRFATFKLGNVQQIASINKVVTSDDEEHKENLSISYCRNNKGETFWLVHLSDKVTAFKSNLVDVNELNNDLDSLLGTKYE